MDFIPLKSRSIKRSFSGTRGNGKKQKTSRPVFLGDPRLLPRIKQHLERRSNSSLGDINKLAEDLQQTFPEYKRKKKAAFRTALSKAVKYLEKNEVMNKMPMKDKVENSNSSSDFSSDIDAVYEDTNMVNSSITSLYKKPSSNYFKQSKASCDSAFTNRSSAVATYIEQEETVSEAFENKNKHFRNISFTSTGVLSNKKKLKNTQSEHLSKHLGTPYSERSKKSKNIDNSLQNSAVTFADVGGIENTLEEVCKLLIHMKHPEIYQQLGVVPPRGFLLHGPPGCGKTLLAYAIAGELELPFIKVAATEIISGVSGESESKIRDLFDKAVNSSPCVLFIDEIDAITPKRETAQREMERRIVAQLLTCMDELNQKETAHVIVIGATNRPDSLDSALRRAGRFDREICLGIPDASARAKILQVLCRKLRLRPQFDYYWLSQNTPGFVGADLMALTREAAVYAINRAFLNLEENVNKHFSEHPIENAKPTLLCVDEISPEHDKLKTKDATLIECESVQLLNPNEHKKEETKSILSWLKDEPPLDEEHLQQLYIEKSDFEWNSQQLLQQEKTQVLEDIIPPQNLPLWCLKLYDIIQSITLGVKEALKVVQPSAKREGFVTVPDVTWNDIGALQSIKEELNMSILAPVKHKEKFEALGLTTSFGILLCGPPGCGKTLLAKAVANESGINFISVKGPELLNMYVGESERAVRQCFQRARNSSPCVIFFDEIDALCPRRSDLVENAASSRVVNQLLTEMDGLEDRKQVFVMGATNRPDIIDPAMLRPGRLDKILFVGLPSPDDRVDILKAITKNGKKPQLESSVNISDLGHSHLCEGFTGADLAALVREASLTALREHLSKPELLNEKNNCLEVNMHHFEIAFQHVKASVSLKDVKMYNKMRLSTYGQTADSKESI